MNWMQAMENQVVVEIDDEAVAPTVRGESEKQTAGRIEGSDFAGSSFVGSSFAGLGFELSA